jgi:hypothetical protein
VTTQWSPLTTEDVEQTQRCVNGLELSMMMMAIVAENLPAYVNLKMGGENEPRNSTSPH